MCNEKKSETRSIDECSNGCNLSGQYVVFYETKAWNEDPNYYFQLTKCGELENVAGQLWLGLQAALEVNIEILVYTALHKKSRLKKQGQFFIPNWVVLADD